MTDAIRRVTKAVPFVATLGLLVACQIESTEGLVEPESLPDRLPDNFTFETIRMSEDREYLSMLTELTFHVVGDGHLFASAGDGSGFTITVQELPDVATGLFVASFRWSNVTIFYAVFSYSEGYLTVYPLDFSLLERWLATDRESGAAQQRLLRNPPEPDANSVRVSSFTQLQDWARFAYEFSGRIREPDLFRVIEIDPADIPEPEHWVLEDDTDVITERVERRAYLNAVPGEADAASFFQVECESGNLMVWLVTNGEAYQHQFANLDTGGVLVEMRLNDSVAMTTLFAQGLAPGDAHVPFEFQAAQLEVNRLFRPDLQDVPIFEPAEFLLFLSALDEVVLRVRNSNGAPIVSVFRPNDMTGRVLQHMSFCE